jgi:hypothetical protein
MGANQRLARKAYSGVIQSKPPQIVEVPVVSFDGEIMVELADGATIFAVMEPGKVRMRLDQLDPQGMPAYEVDWKFRMRVKHPSTENSS